MTLSWLSEESMGSDLSVADLADNPVPGAPHQGAPPPSRGSGGWSMLGAEHFPDARVVEFEGGHTHHIESLDRSWKCSKTTSTAYAAV